MTPDEINEQKNVEFYSASVNAWYNTSLEHDKSLLTLSAGGIGLLITLLTTIGLTSAEALVLYICAITAFVVSLVTILIVFRKNRNYIEDVLLGQSENNDPFLKKLDITALWAFGIGVLFTAVIGITAAIHSYSTKEKDMANEKINKTNSGFAQDSFNGVTKLQQNSDLGKSFNNAGNLKPAASTPVQPPANATPQNKSGK
jgi:hypothetical protein